MHLRQVTESPRRGCKVTQHFVVILMLLGLFACNGPDETFPNVTFPPSLRGLVKDAATGAPVVGATVTTRGHTATTTAAGVFVFTQDFTAGMASVKVTHPGYVDSERQVDIQPFTQADFQLQPK